jgi:hypothetical protein
MKCQIYIKLILNQYTRVTNKALNILLVHYSLCTIIIAGTNDGCVYASTR